MTPTPGLTMTWMEPDFGWRAAEATVALQAVRQAAQLCLSMEASTTRSVWTKHDRSPVTLADLACQALVARQLEKAFPGDPLVAEEDASRLRQERSSDLLRELAAHLAQFTDAVEEKAIVRWIDRGGGQPVSRFWTLDPVDGTRGLLRGGQYAVALALVENGEVTVAAMACPRLDLGWGQGCMFVGVRQRGAWGSPLLGAGWRRLRVSRRSVTSRARLLRSVEADHTDVAKFERIVAWLGVRAKPTLMDGQAKYAVLAAGRADLILRLVAPQREDPAEHIWDHAAGLLLVEEAGGQVTDLCGRRLEFGCGREMRANLGVLASNGHLHAAALEAIRATGADQGPEDGSV